MNLSYLFAELSRRPGRTSSAILSVALGVALFVSLQAYASGYRQAARAPLAEIGADIAAQRQGDVPEAFQGIVFPHSTAPIHRDEINAVRRLPAASCISSSSSAITAATSASSPSATASGSPPRSVPS